MDAMINAGRDRGFASSVQAVLLNALDGVKQDLSNQIQDLSTRLDKVDDRAMPRAEAERRFGEHDDRLKRLEGWQLFMTGQAGDWRLQLQGQLSGAEREMWQGQLSGVRKQEDRTNDWLKWVLGIAIGFFTSLVGGFMVYVINVLTHLPTH